MAWSDWSSPCHLSSFLIHHLSLLPSFCSSHTDFLLIVPSVHQACSCPRAFARALPSAWSTLARASLLKCSFVGEALSGHPPKLEPPFPHSCHYLSLSSHLIFLRGPITTRYYIRHCPVYSLTPFLGYKLLELASFLPFHVLTSAYIRASLNIFWSEGMNACMGGYGNSPVLRRV